MSKWAHTCILHTLTCFNNGILLRDIKRDGGQMFCFDEGPLLILCGPPWPDQRLLPNMVSRMQKNRTLGVVRRSLDTGSWVLVFLFFEIRWICPPSRAQASFRIPELGSGRLGRSEKKKFLYDQVTWVKFTLSRPASK